MPGIFSGCFAESVFQKALSEIWKPKARQRERKGTANNSKWSQNKIFTTRMNQKGIKRVPTDAKVAPKSCLGAFEVLGFPPFVFLENGRNGHGVLVGRTLAKGTSVEKYF